MRNTNKKLLTKIIITGTLLTVGASTLVYTNKVDAKVLPAATTKDINKLNTLANKTGTHYVKTKKWYASFVPGNRVMALQYFNSYKLTNNQTDPGAYDWACYIGTKNINGKKYFIEQDVNTKEKYLIKSEYCQMPYAYKLKQNHKPVYDYFGSLSNAWNGYNEYRNAYGETFTQKNVIYLDNSSKGVVKLAGTGQNTGKYKGFWIGKTPITFYIAGTDKDKLPTTETQEMYPLYIYNPTGELTVSYIKVEDLNQFEPTTVKYNHIGTITKKHAFKPVDKKLDF